MSKPVFGSRINPHRLYRDPARGILAGVCAGVGRYVGVAPIVVRIALVLGLIFFFPLALVTYIVMALAVPPRPRELSQDPEEEAFWRTMSTAPDQTLAGLRTRFRDLEDRLRRIEEDVTSDDFELRRRFRELRS